jgi:hypothetical protein
MFSVATADRTFDLWSSRVRQCILVASQVFESNSVAHWAGSCLIVSRRPPDPGIKGDKPVRRVRVAPAVLKLTDNMSCNGAWIIPQQRVEMIVRIRRTGIRGRFAPTPEE